MLEAVAERVLKEAEKHCNYAEVRGNVCRMLVIKTENSTLKSIETLNEAYVGLRVRINGRSGYAGACIYDGLDAKALVKEAIKAAKIANPSLLSEEQSIKAKKIAKAKIHLSSFPLEEKITLAIELNKLSGECEKIKKFGTWVGEKEEKKIFLSTAGSEIFTSYSAVAVRQISIAKEGKNYERIIDTKSFVGGYEFLNEHNLAEFVSNVSKLAFLSLHAKPPEGGRQTVIFDNKSIGLLLHECFGHACEGDFVVSNNSVLSGLKGKEVAGENVTIIDSGVEEGGIFYPYDEEGVKKERTVVVQNGILKSFLHNRETAFEEGSCSTGNARAESSIKQPLVRQTNFYLEKGDVKPEEILEETKKGIYILGTGAKGGEVSVQTGTFTLRSGPGFVVENGETKKLVRSCVISGNILEVLKNIEQIGNDVKLHFNLFSGCKKEEQKVNVGIGGPHVKIKGVVVGGY